MTLDVAVPPSPELEGVDPNAYEDASVAGDEYHRNDLQGFIEDGAWAAAFEEWAADASLDAAEYEIARDLSLFEEFDFFWDDHADRVGYHAPGIPEDWKERSYHDDLTDWSTVSAINAGLTEFGQIVCEVLADDYVDWESSYEAPDDLPEFD
jgi:hypothetical protein